MNLLYSQSKFEAKIVIILHRINNIYKPIRISTFIYNCVVVTFIKQCDKHLREGISNILRISKSITFAANRSYSVSVTKSAP